ncbi:hypothetical protein J2X02_001988 [Pseudoxanthomonas japonensis]|nr:hypothetical protein [Pseudoxanthomonas japonensis]MDR7069137.1 hypothetical protein [Pseudoxanthomonas japonensis]
MPPVHAVLSETARFDHGAVTNMTRLHAVITCNAEDRSHAAHEVFVPA